jgi:hypothetical protein
MYRRAEVCLAGAMLNISDSTSGGTVELASATIDGKYSTTHAHRSSNMTLHASPHHGVQECLDMLAKMSCSCCLLIGV